MLIGVIGNEYYDVMIISAKNVGNERIAYDKKVTEPYDLIEAFEEIKRIPLDTLIIDFNCDSKENILNEIKNYRIFKPETRIVVLAPNSLPGDPYLSKIFSLGIYDIFAPEVDENNENIETELTKILKYPKTIQDSWKWFSGFEPETSKSSPKVKKKTIKEEIVKEKIVYRDRFVGTVITSIAGTDRGVGCSHLAISLATFLSEDNSVAIVELNDNPIFNILDTQETSNLNSFRLNNIDFFSIDMIEQSNTLFAEILQFGYNYIILDLGKIKDFDSKGNVLYSKYFEEMLRSDFQILVSGGAIWQYKNLPPFMPNVEASSSWQLVFNFMNDISFRNVLSIIKNSGFIKEPLKLPYNNDPFSITEEQRAIFSKIMTLNLKKKKNNRNFFAFFKK